MNLLELFASIFSLLLVTVLAIIAVGVVVTGIVYGVMWLLAEIDFRWRMSR